MPLCMPASACLCMHTHIQVCVYGLAYMFKCLLCVPSQPQPAQSTHQVLMCGAWDLSTHQALMCGAWELPTHQVLMCGAWESSTHQVLM